MLKVLIISILISFAAESSDLEERCKRIEPESTEYGRGGSEILNAACSALASAEYQFVGIEDLWATALKEGRTLFGSGRLWKTTGPQQTGDMLGQTTVGPWQITIANAKEYGLKHGVNATWPDHKVGEFLELRPSLQARLAADFIERSYREFGRRTPYAIQRYFWLEAFLNKQIGQGHWNNSVLAKTKEQQQQTGFYAKQLVLGSRYNPEGLLYWLYRTGDRSAILQLLDSWKKSGYPIKQEDLQHCACDQKFRQYLKPLLEP